MKTKILILVLAATCASGSAAESELGDKGWMSHNMAGSCEMIRSGQFVEGSNITKRVLTLQVLSNPQETSALHKGKTMLSFALFSEEGAMQNEAVESFTVLADDSGGAGKLTVIPIPTHGLSFLRAGEAEAALRLFEIERRVRVQMKDGTAVVFKFPTKGYAASKAMFDACARVLLKNA